MTPAEPDSAARLQRDYRPAFLRYLARRDEPSRTAGYELGRRVVLPGQSMLDLVAAHQVTLLEVLPDARDPEEAASMCTAAAEFLTEVLASFALAVVGRRRTAGPAPGVAAGGRPSPRAGRGA